MEKLVYLGTRRSGEAGKAFRNATRKYSKMQYKVSKIFRKYQHLDRLLKELPADHPDMDSKVILLDTVMEEFEKLDGEWRDLAEQIVEKSLSAAGYQGETRQAVLDVLTDADYHDMVATLSTGTQPSDFSQSPVQRPKQTTTSPHDDLGSGSSLSTASPAGSSTKAK